MLAGIGVRALEKALSRPEVEQDGGDQLLPPVGAGGRELADVPVAVAVDGDARQEVGFGVDDAEGVHGAGLEKTLAGAQRATEGVGEEEVVAQFGLGDEGQHADADLRGGGIGAEAERLAGGVADEDDVARRGLAFKTVDGPGEDPGVAVADGVVASLLEKYGGHLKSPVSRMACAHLAK